MKSVSWLAAVLLVAAAGVPAVAQTKVALGYTLNPDALPAYVAVEEGIFAKHGLAVDMVSIPLISSIPAGLVSGSIQIGAINGTLLVQARDSGLEVVGIAGSSVTAKRTGVNYGLFSQPDIDIKDAKDLVGKKVGAPGLGSFLHIGFQYWLQQNGVDPSQVNFVEVPLANASDGLKSKAVDAMIIGGPMVARVLATKTGKLATYYAQSFPDGQITTLFASTTEWAAKNAETVKAFRAAIAEAGAFIKANPDKVQHHMSKYTKLPLAAAQAMQLPEPKVALTADQITWWKDVLKKQGLVQGNIDPAKAITN